MKPRLTSLILVALGLVSLSLARSQDQFDLKVADLVLLQPKPVQREIGLTADQRSRLNKFADLNRAKLHEYLKAEEKKGVLPNRLSPSDPTIAAYDHEFHDKAMSILSAAQLRRLREITLQQLGVMAILNPVVANRLGLTGAQIGKVRQDVEAFQRFANSSTDREIQNIVAPYRGKRPKDRAQADAWNREASAKVRAAELRIRPSILSAERAMNEKVESTLSPLERSTWKTLLGPPFKMQQ